MYDLFTCIVVLILQASGRSGAVTSTSESNQYGRLRGLTLRQGQAQGCMCVLFYIFFSINPQKILYCLNQTEVKIEENKIPQMYEAL